MPKSNQRGRKNNNPEGYNQHSSGLMTAVRRNPMASAAAAGAAAAAGLFLWSKRDRISEKAGELSEKAGQWSESMRSRNGSGRMAGETGTETVGQAPATTDATGKMAGSTRSTGGRSGKAQSGQNLNPSRTASETVTY